MANITESLGLKLTADVGEWTTAFAKAGVDVEKVSGKVGKLGTGLEAAFGKSVVNVGALTQGVGKLGSSLDNAFTKGTQALAKFSGDVGKLNAEVEKTSILTREISWGKLGEAATHLNQSIELFQKLGAVIREGVAIAKFSAEMDNLERRVPVETLEMMRMATEGAVEKTQLLQFGMRALSGELHVTKEGLDLVLRAANSLADQGFGDTMQNAEALMGALRRGSSRELRQFGIALQDTEDRGNNVNTMLEKFQEIAAKEIEVSPQLKAIERLQTAWADGVADMKKTVGDFLIWFAEAVPKAGDSFLGGVRKADEYIARNFLFGDYWYGKGYLGESGGTIGEALAPTLREAGNVIARTKPVTLTQEERNARGMVPMLAPWERPAPFEIAPQLGRGALQDLGWPAQLFVGQFPRTPRDRKPRKSRDRRSIGDLADVIGGTLGNFDLNQFGFIGGLDLGGLAQSLPDSRALQGLGAGITDFFTTDEAERQEARLADMRSQLEDQTTAIGGTYAALSAGITAAVDAAITGSENIGKAALKASATALKAIAIEAAAKAVFAGAEALLGLNPAAAAAAAKYAAAAAIAGAGAAALGAAAGGGGGGGGSRPSTPAGGGVIGPGATQSGPQSLSIVVQVGDGFVGRADELAVEIADKINHGVQSGRVKNLVQTQPGAVTFR
jgi:hypothetical protein